MNGKAKLPTVSVVIAAYNAEHWIRETLDSVLAQTHNVLEVVVVDDGSTDGTASIVKTYGHPVKCELQPHRGQPAARNHGIRVAKGDFIAFVDADDLWHPGKLEAQINLIHSRGLAWTVCDAEWIDSNNESVEMRVPAMQDGDVLQALLMGNFIISATPVIRQDVFERAGYFNESPEARIGEDWDMWLRIAACFPLGVVWEKLAYLRYHAMSMMSNTSMAEKVHGLEGVVVRAVRREPSRLGPLASRALSNINHRAGVQLMKQNRYQDARNYFLRDLKYRPVRLESVIYIVITLLGPRISRSAINLKRFLWKQAVRLRGKQ